MVAVLQEPTNTFVYLLSSSANVIYTNHSSPSRLKRFKLNDWSLDASFDLPYQLTDGEYIAAIGNYFILFSFPIFLYLLLLIILKKDTKGLNVYISFLYGNIIRIDVSGSELIIGQLYHCMTLLFIFLSLFHSHFYIVPPYVWCMIVGFYEGN